MSKITSHIIGCFVDSVAETPPKPVDISSRMLEAVVELCTSTGLNDQQILWYVTNRSGQSTSSSQSQIPGDPDQQEPKSKDSTLMSECAELSLMLKYLCHICEVDLEKAESDYWDRFRIRQYRLYRQKMPTGSPAIPIENNLESTLSMRKAS